MSDEQKAFCMLPSCFDCLLAASDKASPRASLCVRAQPLSAPWRHRGKLFGNASALVWVLPMRIFPSGWKYFRSASKIYDKITCFSYYNDWKYSRFQRKSEERHRAVEVWLSHRANNNLPFVKSTRKQEEVTECEHRGCRVRISVWILFLSECSSVWLEFANG